MQETSLATHADLEALKNDSATSLARLAAYTGATMTGGVVDSDLPKYSDYGTLVNLQDDDPLITGLTKLDVGKNKKITFFGTDNLGSPVSIASNPSTIRFSPDFVLTEESPGSLIISPGAGGLRFNPLTTPIPLVSGPANPSRRLAFSVNVGSVYPLASVVYGVFRVVVHTTGIVIDGDTYSPWLDLTIGQERVMRKMQRLHLSVDEVSRPIKLSSNIISGFFDLRFSGVNLYGVGPGVTLAPDEASVNNRYVSFNASKVVKVDLVGFYY